MLSEHVAFLIFVLLGLIQTHTYSEIKWWPDSSEVLKHEFKNFLKLNHKKYNYNQIYNPNFSNKNKEKQT